MDNIYIINPGSITLPKKNNPHTYGILERNTFKIKDLEGNTHKEISLDSDTRGGWFYSVP